jgi:hypothetical protein
MLPEQEAALETTSSGRLKALAQQSKKLARIVAKNSACPAELLKELATSTDEAIKKAVTANCNTPIEDLMTLGAQFPKQLLENPIFDLLLLENPNLFEEMPSKTLASLLLVREIPEDFVMLARKYVQRLDIGDRVDLANDLNTAIALLEILACDRDVYVRRSVAINSNTPSELLEILAHDYFLFED